MEKMEDEIVKLRDKTEEFSTIETASSSSEDILDTKNEEIEYQKFEIEKFNFKEASGNSVYQVELAKAIEHYSNGELEKCNEYLENFTYEFESFIEQPIFKFFESSSALKEKILENSSVENSYLMLAMNYIELEYFKKAKWKIIKGLSFYPNNLKLQNLLAKCHIMLKEPDEARQILERGMFLGNLDSIEIFETLWKPNFSFEYFIDVVMNGDLEKVNHFIENGMDLNLQNSEGRTALIYASYLGLKDIVALLLEKGVLLEITDKKEKTAFVYAVERADVELMKLLISHGSKMDLENLNIKNKIKKFVDDGNIGVLNLLFGYSYIEKAENEITDVEEGALDNSFESMNTSKVLDDSPILNSQDGVPTTDIENSDEERELDWEESLKRILSDDDELNEFDNSRELNIDFRENTLHKVSNTEDTKAEFVNQSVFNVLSEKLEPELEVRQKEMLVAIDELVSKSFSSTLLAHQKVEKKSLFCSLFAKKIKIHNFLEFLTTSSKKDIDKFIHTNSIDTKDKAGNTLLLSAIQLEDFVLLEEILALGPDIRIINKAGHDVELLIMQVRVQNRAKIETLYESYKDVVINSEKKTIQESNKQIRERQKQEKKALLQSKKENQINERKSRRENRK
ncbi:MAG: ankyrin repeat domain-containing protein [Fusobacteria bacterium]|nr:ankyrin repeat domain-containing protein [Fusobacteriota bacterium]